jgi:predicted nuclease with TOPRIM domain
MNLETDCKRIVDETIDYARQGMEEFKNEKQAVIKEMREECHRQEEQAAELNCQLQERVDELMEKLNQYSAPNFKIEELEEGPGDVQLEMFAAPKSASAKAGATPMPKTAMNNLAADAKGEIAQLVLHYPSRISSTSKAPNIARASTAK